MTHNGRAILVALAVAFSVGVGVGVGPGPARALVRFAAGRDTLSTPISPFLDEHIALLTQFGHLMQRAVDPAASHADRAGFVLFLRALVLPHARVEEEVLYPALDSVLGTHGYATATLVLDHKAIARLVDDLGALAGSPNPEAYRRKAYALDAVLESHFAKEEQFVLPLLAQRMDPEALRALFQRMGVGGHALIRTAGQRERA